MFEHLYPNFLKNDQDCAAAEEYWGALWQQLDPTIRQTCGWQQPWFQPLPCDLGEGNPIFSAVSPPLRRGIRIIQDEPNDDGADIHAYFDTFGGPIDDPECITELVISCTLSEATVRQALELMRPWVSGGSIAVVPDQEGHLQPAPGRQSAFQSGFDGPFR